MSKGIYRQELRDIHFKTLENFRLTAQQLVYYYQDLENCHFKALGSRESYQWQQEYWAVVGLTFKYSFAIPRHYLAQLGAKEGYLQIFHLHQENLLELHADFKPVVAELFDFSLRSREYAVAQIWFM